MKIRSIFEQDWAGAFVRAVVGIPRSVRLAFTVALAVTVVCWFYDLAQFPLGDHDVGYQGGIPWLSGGRSGRWFAPFLHLLSANVQIPVWTPLLAHSAQIAAGMCAVRLWLRTADFLPLLAGGLLLACMPTAADFYYYHWQAPTFTFPQTLMALSLLLSCPPDEGRVPLRRLAASAVCAVCAFALYQSSVMTWCVLFAGAVLMYALRAERVDVKTLSARFGPALAAFVAACLLYVLSLRCYPLVGLSLETEYQFRTLTLVEMLQRVPAVVRAAYAHFFVIQPFMGIWLKGLLLLTVGAGFAALLYASRGLPPPRRALLLLGVAFLPVAAKAQFFVSAGEGYYLFRFTSLGLNYVYLFFLLALLTSSSVKARNAGLALGVLLLSAMIVNCLHQQILHVRSNTHDIATLNRVVMKIEELPGFSLQKTWNLVQFGRTTSYMDRTYSSWYNDASLSGFKGTISQVWRPGFALLLVEADLKLGARMNEMGIHAPEILRKAVAFAQGKQAFPAPGSVGIVDDIIVLVFDEKAVRVAEQTLQKQEAGAGF
ncbi:MAG: glucosyltransferase domain-containing protein [Desulfovibrio sp.]|nr:glucosyltransferase domain-containing protein [Desulfovibrio sp.]